MKINGPGQPVSGGVTDAPAGVGDADPTKGVAEAPGGGRAGESGRAFAERLDRPAAATTAAPAGPQGGIAVADVAADLRAGRLTARAAVDQLVDRIVAQQLGPQAPASVREQVRATLEDALENDPLLADKLRRLG